MARGREQAVRTLKKCIAFSVMCICGGLAIFGLKWVGFWFFLAALSPAIIAGLALIILLRAKEEER